MPTARFEDFTGLISSLSKEIQRIKAAEAAKLGLKGSDVMCLYYLSMHPEGRTASELAREADVTRAAMSRTLAHLEGEGLVEIGDEPDTATRYRAPVRLTELGRERTASFRNVIAHVMAEAGDGLTDEARAVMYEALSRILAALRRIG